MGKYDSKLLGSEEIARDTFAFHFEKPDGFEFTPGESINLFLPEDFPGVSDDRQRSTDATSPAAPPPTQSGRSVCVRRPHPPGGQTADSPPALRRPLLATKHGAGIAVLSADEIVDVFAEVAACGVCPSGFLD